MTNVGAAVRIIFQIPYKKSGRVARRWQADDVNGRPATTEVYSPASNLRCLRLCKASGFLPCNTLLTALRRKNFMANQSGDNTPKKFIQIDVSSDTVCPWCFVGKKNLEKAMDLAKDEFEFQVQWHPFFLNPSAPKEGVRKPEFYKKKFGADQYEHVIARMTKVFGSLGLPYDTSGLIGNTLDSHRLITFAAHQGYDKQNALVEELFLNYFCQGKHLGDRQVLLDAATKAGIEGAAELLEDPSKGLKEVYEELEKHSANITGVPHCVINGNLKISGGQPPEVFLRAFQSAAK